MKNGSSPHPFETGYFIAVVILSGALLQLRESLFSILERSWRTYSLPATMLSLTIPFLWETRCFAIQHLQFVTASPLPLPEVKCLVYGVQVQVFVYALFTIYDLPSFHHSSEQLLFAIISTRVKPLGRTFKWRFVAVLPFWLQKLRGVPVYTLSAFSYRNATAREIIYIYYN